MGRIEVYNEWGREGNSIKKGNGGVCKKSSMHTHTRIHTIINNNSEAVGGETIRET